MTTQRSRRLPCVVRPPALAALAVLAATASLSPAADGPASWEVASPSGDVRATLELADRGGTADYPPGRRLYWSVRRGDRTVLLPSPLGILRDDRSFVDALELVSATGLSTVDDAYVLRHGKRRECRHRAHELVATFREPGGGLLEVWLRVADDGAAIRYRFPESGPETRRVRGEATGFRLPDTGRVWAHPYDRPSEYTPAYETYWHDGVPVGTAAPSGYPGWAYPLLWGAEDGSSWTLITEAGLGPEYCGTRLDSRAPHRVYRVRLPDPGEGDATGEVEPESPLPWSTPWRVVITGERLATVVESTLVTDLSPPSIVDDPSWVRPGRASWSWLSDHDSPQDAGKLRSFIDLAAEMGWEYTLIDANWTIMRGGTVHDLIRHAAEKGVGVLLWYNSGGPHNHVSEKPRGAFTHPSVRRKELRLLRQWGVKGVKVDFFQSDKQNVIRLYHDILRDAAEAGLMVNVHGCTLPRGWSRTYPHLMSMESVRGAECYSFDRRFAERAPVHNTIIAFTRNVVGPMDYTPVMLADNIYPHVTTNAHEIALSVVFESGWIHFADRVEAYLGLPSLPREFLGSVPAAWDETRMLGGHPGRWVVMARRRGDEWYIGGIQAGLSHPIVELDLSFLADGEWELNLIHDGDGPRELRTTSRLVRAGDRESVRLLEHGGFAARLRPR